MGPNLPRKGISGQKLETVNWTIELCIFELVKVPNVSLKLHFLFFEPYLNKEGIFSLKQKYHTLVCIHSLSLLY